MACLHDSRRGHRILSRRPMRECRDLSRSTGQKSIDFYSPFWRRSGAKTNRKTKSLDLSSSRWLAYAAAGTATALASTHSAEAEIPLQRAY